MKQYNNNMLRTRNEGVAVGPCSHLGSGDSVMLDGDALPPKDQVCRLGMFLHLLPLLDKQAARSPFYQLRFTRSLAAALPDG